MSTFRDLDAPGMARIPPGHVIVPRFAFSPGFLRELPQHLRFDDAGPAIGLRPISDADALTARVQAGLQALEMHPKAAEIATERIEWEKTYRAVAIRHVVGFGTCDANDATKASPYWAADPVEEVRHALTDQGLGLVFDAWERMRLANDPTAPLITPGQAQALALILQGETPFAGLDGARAARVRRLLAHCLEELSGEFLGVAG